MQIGVLDYELFYGVLSKGRARAWELVDLNRVADRNTVRMTMAVAKAACMSACSKEMF
jgi:hypothetical protein